jgi:hypothetical protein
MTEDIYLSKLELLDRLINDPSIPMQPDRIWSLLDEIMIYPKQEKPEVSLFPRLGVGRLGNAEPSSIPSAWPT